MRARIYLCGVVSSASRNLSNWSLVLRLSIDRSFSFWADDVTSESMDSLSSILITPAWKSLVSSPEFFASRFSTRYWWWCVRVCRWTKFASKSDHKRQFPSDSSLCVVLTTQISCQSTCNDNEIQWCNDFKNFNYDNHSVIKSRIKIKIHGNFKRVGFERLLRKTWVASLRQWDTFPYSFHTYFFLNLRISLNSYTAANIYMAQICSDLLHNTEIFFHIILYTVFDN